MEYVRLEIDSYKEQLIFRNESELFFVCTSMQQMSILTNLNIYVDNIYYTKYNIRKKYIYIHKLYQHVVAAALLIQKDIQKKEGRNITCFIR